MNRSFRQWGYVSERIFIYFEVCKNVYKHIFTIDTGVLEVYHLKLLPLFFNRNRALLFVFYGNCCYYRKATFSIHTAPTSGKRLSHGEELKNTVLLSCLYLPYYYPGFQRVVLTVYLRPPATPDNGPKKAKTKNVVNLKSHNNSYDNTRQQTVRVLTRKTASCAWVPFLAFPLMYYYCCVCVFFF